MLLLPPKNCNITFDLFSQFTFTCTGYPLLSCLRLFLFDTWHVCVKWLQPFVHFLYLIPSAFWYGVSLKCCLHTCQYLAIWWSCDHIGRWSLLEGKGRVCHNHFVHLLVFFLVPRLRVCKKSLLFFYHCVNG
jgi:hypothetical protein